MWPSSNVRIYAQPPREGDQRAIGINRDDDTSILRQARQLACPASEF
jgi:hypothetical protein